MSDKLTVKEIQELGQKLIVLYVEDDESIRSSMQRILGIFFGKVHTATNGAEGLEMFQTNAIDFVVTDIQMPKMNGLEMIEHIRELNAQIPIIITTAFNEQSYFIRSIDLKVDKYLLKPIDQDRAKEVFFSVARLIDDRRKAVELEIRRKQESINRISENIIDQIANSYQSPCIVFRQQKVHYVNNAFSALFDADQFESFLAEKIGMDTLFDKRKGFLSQLSEYDELHPENNRFSISKHNGRKIYRVMRKDIVIDEQSTPSLIYVFHDVTLEEYQKIKIKNYAELLQEMLFKTRFKKAQELSGEEAVRKVPAQKKEQTVIKPAGEKLVIDNEQNSILRRSHTIKTSAEVYTSELDDEMLKELQDLDELDDEFGDSIALLQEQTNISGIHQMARQLEQYAHKISLLFEFQDLAYAIKALSKLLMTIDKEKVDEKNLTNIVSFLSGIESDLRDWRRFIFVERSAIDIHYLDSSLYSACLQIELLLSNKFQEMESEEDDLILF